MTGNKSFLRKVGYLCGIAVLFIPISMISAPATTKTDGGQLCERSIDYPKRNLARSILPARR